MGSGWVGNYRAGARWVGMTGLDESEGFTLRVSEN